MQENFIKRPTELCEVFCTWVNLNFYHAVSLTAGKEFLVFILCMYLDILYANLLNAFF